MKRIHAMATMLAIVAACMPQAKAQAPSSSTEAKHYRLTFVLSYPDGRQPSQTFMLDVPVSRDHPGQAGSATTSGLADAPESTVIEKLLCQQVQQSPAGLSAEITFTMDSTAPPVPGIDEPIHNSLRFERKVDLRLGKSTRISEEMQVKPLREGDPVPASKPPAPQISVTAVEI